MDEETTGTATGNSYTQGSAPRPEQNAGDSRKHVRMCWICHDEVEPTYEQTGILDGMRNRRPKRQYISEDGDRLVNPCRCKGSVKMERLNWAQRLRSPIVALGLTVFILLTTIFILGFIADPILNLWLDPVGTIADSVTTGHIRLDEDIDLLPDEAGWFEHFLKGLFSLGLLGFVKAFLVMSPWQWWNLRTSGIIGGGGRRGGTGRERMESINLLLVLIGVVTFLYAVWKATRKWTERTLDRASQRILNVQRENNDVESDESDGEDD
ncbi:hypothetical protein F4820DRAFT_442968 [Hypoxylon rubiginosum]|uniref:Uncharacterized protein n=1 Tax=Hypoxylon rubiginosum TaxID=110542 RepID=A0ACB9ZG11_9PEZI|nr:hypothetical protein F4820DRAFT_442968 [Hypoxylon rubiginosum]